jgi:hypothetical protein
LPCGAWALFFSSARAHNRIGEVNETATKEIPKILFTFLFSALLTIAGVSLLSWRELALTGQSISDCERRVTALEILAAGVATENAINSLARADHKAELGRLGAILDRIRDDITALKTRPEARSDPFTGTEAREMEKRFDRRMQQLEHTQ